MNDRAKRRASADRAHGRFHERIDPTLRSAWCDLLGRYEWTAFGTLTYSLPQRSSARVVEHVRTWLRRWQRREAVERGMLRVDRQPRLDGYGRRIGERVTLSGRLARRWRCGQSDPVWVLGVERHQSMCLHAHLLLRESSALPAWTRKIGWDEWINGMGLGRARIESPRCHDDVVQYVSKYVCKPESDLFLGPKFDAAMLPVATDPGA